MLLDLQQIIDDEKIEVIEKNMTGKNKGFYADNTMMLDTKMSSSEKRCKIGEELGHHFTSAGDIISQDTILNVKQERKARVWGYENLVPLNLLVEAINYPCQSKRDLAEYFLVTECYIEEALDHYKARYGDKMTFNEYIISFKPLRIIKMFK
ncbi:MAG: hypothetical protein K0Q65_456 [Clostridia bacterium]|nr:hypothetical protein [Clostridia bacterium]